MEKRYYYGFKRDKEDPRDHVRVFGAAHIAKVEERPVVDLSEFVDHDYDQGVLESCTANALCAAYGLELKRQRLKSDSHYHYFNPSRLFVYYNSRANEGTEKLNVPVSYRSALKSIHKIGVCHESLWPYDISKVGNKPPPKAYEDAVGNSISKYERLTQNLTQVRACLGAGYPFVLGFEVYPSFHDEHEGLMPIPTVEEVANGPLGLHAVLIVGYNDHKKHLKALNSYGEKFGDKGYFYIPYAYAMNTSHCFDFWKIVHSSESDVDPLTDDPNDPEL